jgi:hypothetical protein
VNVGEVLIGETELSEVGTARPGFAKSERRTCFGGSCWRRYEPHQASRRFGTFYESWEWDGVAADWAGRRLRGCEGYPSRVDVAWDFVVPEELRAGEVAESMRGHAEAVGISLGSTGQGEVFTHYVGAVESPRRIRIYRKDLQSAAWLFQFGATMRVELILRDVVARSWWEVFRADDVRGIRVAAGHVREMTGRELQADWSDVPAPCVTPEADAAQLLLQFVNQHGVTLAACADAGIDLAALVRERRQVWGRLCESRLRERLSVLGQVPAEELEELVLSVLRKGRAA